jgi:hypothetical protein
MSTELMHLYKLLGVAPPQQVAKAGAQPMAAALAAPPPNRPLGPNDIPELRGMLKEKPDAVAAFFSIARGRPVTPKEAEGMVDELDFSLNAPTQRIALLEGKAARAAVPPPADFNFDLYPQADIPIDTAETKFETRADWFGYAVHGGINAVRYHSGTLDAGPMRSHAQAESKFIYLLDRRKEDEPLPIALFADFANGYYHSRYLARRIARNRYPYAAHLGDVYYAGEPDEVDRYLREPLQEVLDAQTEVFLIEGNHEMYSRGVPWLAYIDEVRTKYPNRQRQEGQYFRLKRNCPNGVSKGFQIIAADTAWYEHARYGRGELREWLRESLKLGRDEGRMNILLTSNEPYEYGKKGSTALWSDLRDLVIDNNGASLVDLWFWGNTHYCALFERTTEFPFVGTCIGHGGYPYSRYYEGEYSPAPCRWVEDDNRFGRDDTRPDRGNNGYCELVLNPDGTAELVYIDWMGRTRHKAKIRRNEAGVVLS